MVVIHLKFNSVGISSCLADRLRTDISIASPFLLVQHIIFVLPICSDQKVHVFLCVGFSNLILILFWSHLPFIHSPQAKHIALDAHDYKFEQMPLKCSQYEKLHAIFTGVFFLPSVSYLRTCDCFAWYFDSLNTSMRNKAFALNLMRIHRWIFISWCVDSISKVQIQNCKFQP